VHNNIIHATPILFHKFLEWVTVGLLFTHLAAPMLAQKSFVAIVEGGDDRIDASWRWWLIVVAGDCSWSLFLRIVTTLLGDNEREHAGMHLCKEHGCVLACPFPLSPILFYIISSLSLSLSSNSWWSLSPSLSRLLLTHDDDGEASLAIRRILACVIQAYKFPSFGEVFLSVAFQDCTRSLIVAGVGNHR
jgi:hypothetical protein